MNAIFLCLVLASCQNVDVVDIRDGHFAYRDLKTDTKPQECFIYPDRTLVCRDMDWERYRGLAQFSGKVRVVK